MELIFSTNIRVEEGYEAQNGLGSGLDLSLVIFMWLPYDIFSFNFFPTETTYLTAV